VKRGSTLRWSAHASEQFKRILDHLGEYSIDAGDDFQQEVEAALQRLPKTASMGRLPRDFAAPARLRELLIGQYRLGYQPKGARLEVVYVVHARRRFTPREISLHIGQVLLKCMKGARELARQSM
jgi:plasmid stabilization system protein ParE